MKNKTVKSIRLLIGIIILLVVTGASYLHQTLGGAKAPSIHALCPYGALESINNFFLDGNMIDKIFAGTFIILIGSIILAIIFRRSFCGIICPFGTLQELFAKLGKLIFKKQFTVPEKLDKPARYLKYIVLTFTIFMAWKTASIWISPYDPWTAYSHLTSSELLAEYSIGLIILIIILLGSMLYDRFFCKYLCPMGAFLGIVSKLSPSRITRNKQTCANCNLCSKSCPANIKVSELDEVKSAECLNCQQCVLSCPKKGTLEMKFKKHTVSPSKYIVVTIAIFALTILIARSTGVVMDMPKKATVKTTEQIQENIKGFMTLKEVSEATGVELEKIYHKAGFTREQVPPNTKCKEIGEKLGKSFETSKVRDIIVEINKENE